MIFIISLIYVFSLGRGTLPRVEAEGSTISRTSFLHTFKCIFAYFPSFLHAATFLVSLMPSPLIEAKIMGVWKGVSVQQNPQESIASRMERNATVPLSSWFEMHKVFWDFFPCYFIVIVICSVIVSISLNHFLLLLMLLFLWSLLLFAIPFIIISFNYYLYCHFVYYYFYYHFYHYYVYHHCCLSLL